MRAPKPPYPSFTLVLTQQSYPVRLPVYGASRMGHLNAKSSRMLDLEDPLMRTIGNWYDSPDSYLPGARDSDADTLISLEGAISSEVHEGRMRRLSLSTLVVDLALTVKRSLEKLRAINKDSELESAMSTQ